MCSVDTRAMLTALNIRPLLISSQLGRKPPMIHHVNTRRNMAACSEMLACHLKSLRRDISESVCPQSRVSFVSLVSLFALRQHAGR